jgi:hypothetical protein
MDLTAVPFASVGRMWNDGEYQRYRLAERVNAAQGCVVYCFFVVSKESRNENDTNASFSAFVLVLTFNYQRKRKRVKRMDGSKAKLACG